MTDSTAVGKPGAGPQKWELVIATGANGTKPEIFCQLTTTSRPFEISPVIRCSDEAGKSFKKNSTDTYKFDLPTPLAGDVFMIQVWHKNEGYTGSDSWRPKSMVLKGNGKVYNFVIPEDTCIDAGQTFEFFPGDAAIGKYTVKVKTGTTRGAGTDAKVKLNIIGTKGQSRFRALRNKWRNDFEKGSEDSFNVTSADLGEITGVDLKVMSTKTFGGDWQCESITVLNEAGDQYVFGVNKEFNPDSKKTHKITGPTFVGAEAEEEDEEETEEAPVVPNAGACQTKLVGKVFTADEIGAGTDAKVTIWFTDVKGQCVGPLKIAEVGGDTMEQGQINNITVELVEKLDALAKVSIKTGGEGFGDKWKLAKIEFTAVDPATNVALAAKQVFDFNQWISAKKVYECAPLGADGSPNPPNVYTIEVKTTNQLFAGTDNDVYINVQGSKGQTQFRKLSNKYHNDFEQGNTDKFEILAVDLGTITGVQLMKKGHDDWKCDSVKVITPLAEATFDFGGKKVGKVPVIGTLV